tara:strand:- start:201 stop:503 length:303 start_codon:yes stop_codon:yes gene_type:complete
MTKPSKNNNTFLLLDMEYSELVGVSDEYDNPSDEPAISWVVQHSSYPRRDNGESGVYDYIFNLAMLEGYIEDSPPPAGVGEQLKELCEQGYSYILFNQGC